MQSHRPSHDIASVSISFATRARDHRTRFVPLCSVQIESPISTRSPSEKGNELPFAMAEATADLRKSIVVDALATSGEECRARGWAAGGQWPWV